MRTKPLHWAPKPSNTPDDMVAEPPVPCEFAVGDTVTYTNPYGIKFDFVVRGFTPDYDGSGRFVYIFTDCWWFPVQPGRIRHRAATPEDAEKVRQARAVFGLST